MQKKQIEKLTSENRKLKEVCEERSTLSVMMFYSKNDASVAVVTDESQEGVQTLDEMKTMFTKRQKNLQGKGYGFAVCDEIPINKVYDLPWQQ